MMDLVKKNMVSVICGGVIVIAIAALFWPISGYYQQLQTKAQSRSQVYNLINGLLQKKWQKPVLPTMAELASAKMPEPQPLDQFPTDPVISAYKAAVDQLTTESKKLYDAAVQMNAHPELVAGALPSGGATVSSEFRTLYKRDLPNPQDMLVKESRKQSLAGRLLNAGYPPTPDDIKAATVQAMAALKERTPIDQTTGNPFNPQAFADEQRRITASIPDQERRSAADSCRIYVEPDAMAPYAPLTTAAPAAVPEPRVVYIAQVGWWIQKDVLDAIAAANQAATSVRDAPVKHLWKIALADPSFTALTNPMRPMAGPAGAAPPPGPADPAAPTTPNYAQSPTGRATNPLYDVYRYSVKVNVEADQVPRILMELSRSKFITVTSVAMLAVDSGQMQVRGFYYGPKPVVQMDIQCESLFLRKWTEPLMPPAIRLALGIPEAKPAGAQ